MSAARFREVVAQELVPFLPGAELSEGTKPASTGKGLVLKLGERAIGVRLSEADPNLLEVKRAQPFSAVERGLVQRLLQTVGRIAQHCDEFFFSQALSAAVRQTIVTSLDYPSEALLLRVLTEFESLASQTYEGHRIAAAIGLDDTPRTSGVKLETIWGEDFGKVLTGSIETMITVSPEGYIDQFRTLYTDSNLPQAPHYARTIAQWCVGKRLAVTLNRNGEILIFKENSLVFAWRRGRWRHFAHPPILQQMRTVNDKALRACIYETCLDVSFGRSGGCIGVVLDKHKPLLKDIVNKADRIQKGDSRKAQVITQFLDQTEHNRLFTKLPRRLRQAMAAIDGALVLNHKGEVLAVGAIVKVESGSDAGARKAAARALARMGFGVKISADGGVVGFCDNGDGAKVERVFEFG
ncbi:MAG: hypothetical protein IT435_19050 [Phycisphaerales bacterium]|nr:hypothetical protein [Phycisphaerales bacterium]